MKPITTADLNQHQSAFGTTAFRSYFPSGCFSTLGSWIVRFLLGWSAWELTHSALWVGVTAGLMLFPTFLLSPIFGIISDRVNPRNGLLGCLILQALLAMVAGLGTLLELYSLPWLLCLATALGCITAANAPMRLALVPLLVPRQALPSAVGISAIIFNTSRILGPAAGAWLLTAASISTAFFTAMTLLLCSLPFLLSIHCPPRKHQQTSHSMFRQFAAGIQYVREHRGIRLVFAHALINGLLGRSVIELLPALSGQMLAGDPATLATLTASAGAGSIMGGLIMSRQGSNEARLLNLLSLSLFLSSLCLLAARWLEGLLALSLLIAALSLLTTMVGTGSQVMSQLLVEENFRGRVLSLWTVLAMGVPAIGALIMGALADRVGFPLVLAGFALMAAAGVAVLFRKRQQFALKNAARGDGRDKTISPADLPVPEESV